MLKNTLHIQFATEDDLYEIAELSRDEVEYGLGWKYTEARLSAMRRNRFTNIVVARIGSKLAGFGLMTYSEHCSNLDLLATKPQYRRQKIATTLVDWLVKVANDAGMHTVFVQVRERNRHAIQFYHSLGFREIDKISGYYQRKESAVIMVKALRPLVKGLDFTL